MIRTAILPALAAMLLAVSLAACGGSGTKTTTHTVGAGSSQPPPPAKTFTNLPAVDQVASAAVAHDSIELAGLTGYQKIACLKDAPEAGGGPPACRADEADGKDVEVLPSQHCADGRAWIRPEQVPDAFSLALPPPTTVVAAYAPKADPAAFGGGFGGTQVLVFQTGAAGASGASGAALHIKDGRVVWIETVCQNLSEFLTPERVDSFIIDPKGIAVPAPPPTEVAAPTTDVPPPAP